MTTNAVQLTLQPQPPVSASAPTSQGRFSLNCNTFIKLATLVSSVAAAVIAYLAEQYLIAGLTASLAAFAVYSFCRGETTTTPQSSTTPLTPGQTPQPQLSTPPTTPRQNPQPQLSTPPTTPGQTQQPLPPLPLNNTSGNSGNGAASSHTSPRSGSGSPSTSTVSSVHTSPRSGSEELADLDEDDAPLGETGGGTSPRTPIVRTIAALQVGEAGNDSATSSNTSSPIHSRSASERNLAALDLAESTRRTPVRPSVKAVETALSESSSDSEEGSVVERTDLVQGSDPTSIAKPGSFSSPQEHPPLRTAGRDSENDEVEALVNGRSSSPKSVVRSLTPTFNAEAENVTRTDTTEPDSTFSENLIDLAFIEEEGT